MSQQHWSETEKGKEFIQSAFKAANLPEVNKNQLETGTYTNQEIAKMFNDPRDFMVALMRLPHGGGKASRRSILSFAVDLR